MTEDEEEQEVYKCSRCGKEFDSSQGLGSHKAWHHKKDKQELPKEVIKDNEKIDLKVVE